MNSDHDIHYNYFFICRVRKPPGGDSSFNIFGIPNEPNNAKKVTENNNQKATDNTTQKATDNTTQKATDDTTQNATGNEESHVTTDVAVAKEDETCQKAEGICLYNLDSLMCSHWGTCLMTRCVNQAKAILLKQPIFNAMLQSLLGTLANAVC